MGNLVGKKAPTFVSKAVIKDAIVDSFTLKSFLGRNVVFFFYPLDFTFVCPTEIHAFQERLQEFQDRNTEVIGCSVDSPYSHYAWLNTPKEQGGILGVEYPLVSDLNKQISRDYGVLDEDQGIAYRGLFLIDTKGVVRHALVNDLPLGRSVDEALRIVDALNFFERNGEVCPANWQNGKRSMLATQDGLKTYFAMAH